MSKYNFSDIPGEQSSSNMKKENGCFVKTVTGFVIAFLAIAIAVGVGVIVHFAENRKIECVFPDNPAIVPGNAQQQSGGSQAQCPTLKPQPCPTCSPALQQPGGQQNTDIPSTQSPTATPTEPTPTKDVFRLPRSFEPLNYKLRLQPEMYGNDPEAFTFTGTVTITIKCNTATDAVMLHVDRLNITESTATFSHSDSMNDSPRIVSHAVDKDKQVLTIKLDKETAPGDTYNLYLEFVGQLRDDLDGLYYSSYTSGNNTVYMAVTQFEDTMARKAFPCFDEPNLKATFEVTLVRKDNLMSLSNMPIKARNNIANHYVEDVYEPSLKMSTYLLAFVIGPFKQLNATGEHGLKFGTWALAEYVNQTDIALDVGVKIITKYEQYFDIEFPLPKQDMIAIPDFAAGAMENWGLVTYRDIYLLYKPGVSSHLDKQMITTVVAHELGHQWFGDLVTMQWWDDIWLNEGFATFLEYKGTGMIHHDWRMSEQFIVKEMHKAMEVDSLVTSRPIISNTDNPFDIISYQKGGSVILMMEFILGEETFRKGLSRYLNEHKFGNAAHNDLWNALNGQANTDGLSVNVKEIMDTWTLQMNYPVVHVTRQNGRLRITQQRFLKNPNATDPGTFSSKYNYVWRIPFTYTTRMSNKFLQKKEDIKWLTKQSQEIAAPGLHEDDWIIGNVMQSGFYRVNYDVSNWQALIQQLKTKHQVIPAVNRAQIISDAWSLSRADMLSTDIALKTLEYLDHETDYITWYTAEQQILYLDDMLKHTDIYGLFQKFIASKVKDPFEQFGLNVKNESHMESLTRESLSRLACNYGVQSCVVESKKLFAKWMQNPRKNTINPTIRQAVYCTAISEGGTDEWEFLLDQYKVATVAAEKTKLAKALACTTSSWLLSRYLELTIDPTVIRKQDAVKAMQYISYNPVGQLLAWDFVRARWNNLYNSYGKGAFSFTRLLSGLTVAFNTEFQLNQLKTFQTDFPEMGGSSSTFNQILERTQANINWLHKNRDNMSSWLRSLGVSKTTRVTDVRLPVHLTPTMYRVVIQPNMYTGNPDEFTFEGFVRIYMTANDVGRNVTLHVNKLNISENSIRFGTEDGSHGPSYNGQRQTDKDRQFEIFYLDADIVKNTKYYIEMNFTGPLIGDLAGLYLSTYKRGGDNVYIATTQFESTDARKAFPCFDEPQIKAVFNVSLIRKSNMTSIFNMPLIQSVPVGNDFMRDDFQHTAKMSSYLLAFVVADFAYTTQNTSRGVTYRAWSRKESVNQTAVALETGTILLSHYEDYFGIDFPLPKQDMIAIPDFSAGAMENWGLITYRETAMLYEPGVAAETNLQRVNVVVAHELAHQWFGDLVTMKWWDDLWLNEGFASFVEYMGVDYVHPEWKMFEQFVFEIYDVFEIDSLVTSHPIYVPVYNPDEINEIFDGISYGKGACVIRMTRFFLGEETFQKGLQGYLKSRKFDNADHNDLWNGFQQQADSENKNIKVREILDTWILQMNYPVVMVTNSSNGNVQLTQDRFIKNKEATDPHKYESPFQYQWQIPFTFTTSEGTNFNQSSNNVEWMTTQNLELTENYPNGWIIGNVQQYGVYRVNYEESNWMKLIEQLKTEHRVIHVLNRGQIINDAFGLATAKQLRMEIALQTLEYLNQEDEYVPWVAAGSELSYINHMLAESDIYGAFQHFMRDKVNIRFKALGMNGTNLGHIETYLRNTIATKACFYGNEDCITTAKDLLERYMATPEHNPIDPDLKSLVYCTSVREGGETEWEFIYQQYKKATVQAEKSRLLSAMACTRKVWIINRLLRLAMNDSEIRKQDAYKVFVYVGRNPIGRAVAWNFFRSNWDDLFKTYGVGSFSMSDIVTGVTNSFNTEFQLQQLEEFRQSHPDMGSGTRAFAQVIESTQANIQWMDQNYNIVKQWLSSYL